MYSATPGANINSPKQPPEKNMFKHLLLPTDGSEFSATAIQNCMQLAKSVGAKVTGFYVMPEIHMLSYQVELPQDAQQRFARDCQTHADQVLAAVADAAKAAGVVCDTACVTSDHPFDAIVRVATERGCDLIVMASHGRKGIRGILLGSETQKVLTHSKIPVLVYR